MKNQTEKRMNWSPAMRATLLSLYRQGYTSLEIAEYLELELRQVYYATSRAKRGLWGEKYRVAFNLCMPQKTDCHLDQVLLMCDRLGIKYADYQKYVYLAKADMLLPAQKQYYEQIVNFGR